MARRPVGGLGSAFDTGLKGILEEAAKEMSEIMTHEVKAKTSAKIQKKENVSKAKKRENPFKRGFEAIFGKGEKKPGRPKKSVGLGHGIKALFDSIKKLRRRDNRSRRKHEPRTVSKELPAAPREIPEQQNFYDVQPREIFRAYGSVGDKSWSYKPFRKGEVSISTSFNNRVLMTLKLIAKFFYRVVSRTPVDEDYKYTESREIDPTKKKSFVLGKARNMQYKVMPKTKSGVYEKWHKKDDVVAREEWTLSIITEKFTMKDFDGIDFERVGSESWMDVYKVIAGRFNTDAYGEEEFVKWDAIIENKNPYIDVLEYGQYKKKDVANDAEKHKGKKYFHGTNAGYSVQAPRGMIRLTDAEFEKLRDEYYGSYGDLEHSINPDRLELIGRDDNGIIQWTPPVDFDEPDKMNDTFWKGFREAVESERLFDERDILSSLLEGKPSVAANAESLRRIRYKAEQELFKRLRKVEGDKQKVKESVRQLKKALSDKKKEIERLRKEESKRIREERKKVKEAEKARKAMSVTIKVQTPKLTTSKEIFREAIKNVKKAPEQFEKKSTDPTVTIAFGEDSYEITVNELGDYGVKLDNKWVDFLELYKVYNKSPKAKSKDFDDWIDSFDLDWQY